MSSFVIDNDHVHVHVHDDDDDDNDDGGGGDDDDLKCHAYRSVTTGTPLAIDSRTRVEMPEFTPYHPRNTRARA